MAVVLERTIYGRATLAIGQNMRAAHLAGVAHAVAVQVAPHPQLVMQCVLRRDLAVAIAVDPAEAVAEHHPVEIVGAVACRQGVAGFAQYYFRFENARTFVMQDALGALARGMAQI